MDPMRQWLDWLEAATRATTAAARGPTSAGAPGAPGAAPNPFAALFAVPFVTMPPNPLPEPLEVWRRWLEALPLLALNPFAAQPASGAGAGAGAAWPDLFGMAEWWRDHLATSAVPGAPPATSPADPWVAFRQWYERASAAMSPPLEDFLRSDAFTQAAGAFWENATIAIRATRHAAEAQLAALGMASRGDVARVASLVVQVEAKVDRIEEALEDAQDAQAVRHAGATERADALTALERHVERIEAKLDRLLAALEAPERREPAAPASTPEASAATGGTGGTGTAKPAARAHKPSTTRGRRKPPSAT